MIELPKGFTLLQPITETQLTAYHQLRYRLLREPWQQPKGSETDELERQSTHRMIVDSDGRVAAVGRLHKSAQDQGQIRFMAVDPAYQGKGLGKLMLQALEQQAIKDGVATILLNAREVALDFYLACDYQLIGEAHTLYGQVKHFAMTKSLTSEKSLTGQTGYQSSLQTLSSLWQQTIPITQAFKFIPCFYDQQVFVVSADRSANVNLHQTMFAGSIYSLATLTGWGWVYMQLQQHKLQGDIVLADANIRYHQPLHGYGVGRTKTSLNQGDFSHYQEKGKTRFNVSVEVFDGDSLCATYTGLFAVRRANHEK
ncbi:GNAT family N-acetyltransferase [Thalassotalea litorea]|uniref:GNAT family N-acetyltransferase n=1 Tax=Thalassotalea litorea TaxID=2020715 RepID=A0A5R9INI0_9GAMM|nr:bifunctional GNAT family N-acetyltransferase/hotdog fold thioesterase [Thalassotalea litorea]TLU67105.1 GNAT family N-acetyltransferase [Thalassotalea litorea]